MIDRSKRVRAGVAFVLVVAAMGGVVLGLSQCGTSDEPAEYNPLDPYKGKTCFHIGRTWGVISHRQGYAFQNVLSQMPARCANDCRTKQGFVSGACSAETSEVTSLVHECSLSFRASLC